MADNTYKEAVTWPRELNVQKKPSFITFHATEFAARGRFVSPK